MDDYALAHSALLANLCRAAAPGRPALPARKAAIARAILAACP